MAPLWAGLSATVGTALPLAGIFLVPLGAARLARTALGFGEPVRAFTAAALVAPVSFLLAALLAPGQSWVAAIVGTAFVALPALAVVAGARDGRRRDRLHLLVASVTAIGALSAVLGFALATGDPGRWLAAKSAAATPELIGYYRANGFSESWILAIGRTLAITQRLFAQCFPGIVLAGCVIYAAVVVYPFGGIAGLEACGLEEPSFSRYSTPSAAAVAFIPAGLLAALGPPAERAIAVDLLLPLAALFFLRGLAIIRALLDRGRAGLLGRAAVYALVLWMPFPVILALGGLFDEFLNFRGRLERADEAGS